VAVWLAVFGAIETYSAVIGTCSPFLLKRVLFATASAAKGTSITALVATKWLQFFQQ